MEQEERAFWAARGKSAERARGKKSITEKYTLEEGRGNLWYEAGLSHRVEGQCALSMTMGGCTKPAFREGVIARGGLLECGD